MKKMGLLFVVFIFATLQIKAQLEKEIKVYVDSTEIFVNNGRRLLVEEIQSFNYPKVKEVFQLLKEKTKFKKCVPFGYNEEMFISLITSDWEIFFNNAIDYKKRTTQFTCYSTNNNIYRQLFEEFQQNVGVIKSNFEKASYPNEEKEVFNIFIYLMEKGKTDDKYDAMIKNYKKTYPKSKYKDFFDMYLPNETIKASMGFSIGAIGFFTNGKLKENLKTNVGFSASMDFNINKVYTSLYVDATNFKLLTPFNVSSNGLDYKFQNGDQFSYIDAGLYVGYYLLRNKSFRIAPYVNVGVTTIESNLFEDPNDSKYEYKITNTFSPGIGINSEYKIAQFKSKNIEMENSFLSLKFNAGYNLPVKYNYPLFRGNITYTSLTLCWGVGYF